MASDLVNLPIVSIALGVAMNNFALDKSKIYGDGVRSPLDGRNICNDVEFSDGADAEGTNSGFSCRVYLIETHSGLRAKIARMIFAQGVHAEIFGSIGEFLLFSPSEAGVMLINEDLDDQGGVGSMKRLHDAGVSLPVIIYGAKTTIEKAISVMRAGAADYLALDKVGEKIHAVIESISSNLGAICKQQNRLADLNQRVRSLSVREGQVLEFLAGGFSNKEIAKILSISPRTVEIHRMKMMAKISAKSSADAVRIWCSVIAGLDIQPNSPH